MAEPRNPASRRPWRNLILVIVLIVLALLALALWSEREDARRLPPEQMEGVEETFQGPV
jgi:hypothetical protein